MNDPLAHLPQPQPDVERLKTVLRRGRPDRVPLFELAIADEVLAALHSTPLLPLPADSESSQLHAWAEQRVRLWWRLGYDYYRVRVNIPFTVDYGQASEGAPEAVVGRQWVNEQQGLIQTQRDFELYPWPSPDSFGFEQAEAAIACLPEGMEAVGFSGGVLEWASALMGLEHFMMMLHEEPDLVRKVVDRVGDLLLAAFERFCDMPKVFALWLGDDMGFKTATLISPDHLREYILPWHRRFAQLAHRTGRFFLLHSCGYVDSVMPDLIDYVGIDGKHSFEDAIVPVEEFKRRWGDRVAVLGGLDVDLLSRASPEIICRRTRHILERCSPGGGYACGSGNSVTNYVSPGNFLAMVETVHRFNGRMAS
ncbi:MAG: uroporphyrinogen decarboxylase family protein [Phycisphaerae bacterium]